MSDTRQKDSNWSIGDGPSYSYDAAHLAVLMDLRDELKRLNRLLHCPNFIEIPRILREIRRNTTRRKRKAVKK